MSELIDVSPDALHAHAASVRTFMTQIDEAASQAGNINNVLAFGLVGEFFALIASHWITSAKSFVSAATKAGGVVADQLDTMAQAYRDTDEAASVDLRKAAGKAQ